MRHTSLPSPGVLTMGHDIRMDSARAISSCEIVARRTAGGKTKAAATLKAFFDACSTALTAIADAVAPTVSTRVRTATNTLTVTFNEALSTDVVPATSCFVFTPTRTVTAVAVAGSTVVVTATGVIATDSVAYTQPAVNKLQDKAGNAVASFSGVIA